MRTDFFHDWDISVSICLCIFPAMLPASQASHSFQNHPSFHPVLVQHLPPSIFIHFNVAQACKNFYPTINKIGLMPEIFLSRPCA